MCARMGLDFLGNPNKIEYEDIDEIGADDYSDDENVEAFGNWIETYESSEYDDADDYNYDSYGDFYSDSDTWNGSELPDEPLEYFATNAVSESEEEEDLQQKSNNTLTPSSTKVSDSRAASEEAPDPSISEADSNT